MFWGFGCRVSGVWLEGLEHLAALIGRLLSKVGGVSFGARVGVQSGVPKGQGSLLPKK